MAIALLVVALLWVAPLTIALLISLAAAFSRRTHALVRFHLFGDRKAAPERRLETVSVAPVAHFPRPRRRVGRIAAGKADRPAGDFRPERPRRRQ